MNSKLNYEQKLNVQNCLDEVNFPYTYLIHGPPGTGKTSTLVELIMQFLVLGKRVLVCSSSNAAVDNLAIRFFENAEENRFPYNKYNPVRIGSMISVNKKLDKIKLSNLGVKEKKKIEDSIRQLNLDLNSLNDNPLHYGAKNIKIREKQDELKKLLKTIIGESKLTFGTLSSNLKEEVLNGKQWDVLIIDEASQSKITECLIPLKLCKRVILAGDDKQLPPVFRSYEGFDKKLNSDFYKSFFEMIYNKQKKNLCHPLKVQYRMNQTIMEFSSYKFYDNSLIAHDSVKNRLISDNIPNLSKYDFEFFSIPIHYLDTNKMKGFHENKLKETFSFENKGEADYIIYLLSFYSSYGISPENIGVITGYRGQVNCIFKSAIRKFGKKKATRFEINTVDSFQGREKDIIILSLVRSNEVGFYRDVKRLNVALTRAKKQLIVIGNLTIFSRVKIFEELYNHLYINASCLNEY